MFNNVTIIFVSYFSKTKLLQFIKQFNNKFKVIVIENSKDTTLINLLKKYDNVSIIYNKKNLGFGASSNIGLKNTKTKYALHLDLDTKFSNSSIIKLLNEAEKLKDFIILGPKIKNYNYKYKDYISKKTSHFFPMNFIDGCCLLFKMKNLRKIGFFDKNFFLYYEEFDLIKRCNKKKNNVFMTDKVMINHKGRSSSDSKFNKEIEVNRNWHLLWSKFYFYKKHYNYFYALYKISNSFISSFFKKIIFKVIKNDYKYSLYSARFSGCMNSMLNKKSWFRPNIES